MDEHLELEEGYQAVRLPCGKVRVSFQMTPEDYSHFREAEDFIQSRAGRELSRGEVFRELAQSFLDDDELLHIHNLAHGPYQRLAQKAAQHVERLRRQI